MKRAHIVMLLVCLWLLVQIWSFWASSSIEGPRNIDTGFKKLDVWFQWQLLAFGLAIAAAIAGFLTPENRWRNRLSGLIPLGMTLLVVGGFFVFATLNTGHQTSGETPRSQVTKPAEANQAPD